MSRFSGKCDLYDVLIMIHNYDLDAIKRCKIYLNFSFKTNDQGEVSLIPGDQLQINSMKDIIPYYPYTISMSYGDEDGMVIFLSEKSWPDTEREKLEEYGCEYKMYDFYKKELEDELKKYEHEW